MFYGRNDEGHKTGFFSSGAKMHMPNTFETGRLLYVALVSHVEHEVVDR